MLIKIPEQKMHWVRWVLTSGWLLLIGSLLYDPWTSALTKPDHPWSPLRLADVCIKVQGECVPEEPYALGATLFWGAVVPSGVFILLVFGHELWRRICPLSFLSQIPRALGWQRQFKRENQKTGKIRYELAKVKADSWLGKNYAYLQFAWLFTGLCGRILFFNADRLMLALWILFAIAAAIFVGYFYGGKSWCQYFCPMAPVQTIFSEPRGLLGSKPHLSDEKISQSMCRTVLPDKTEQSACVACQSPCFDIDSERAYWDRLNTPEKSFVHYGYVGLVIGYFVYYYLYAGNWDYYFSGIWNRDPNQLASLMNPGLYFFGQAINIPKLFAVPLVLGLFTAIAIILGRAIEAQAQSYFQKNFNVKPEVVRHRLFAICTFLIFDFFFIFAGRPLIKLLPIWVQYAFDLSLVFLSTLWLQKTWNQSREIYSRESLALRLRKQLEKLQLDVSQFLEGRSLKDLKPNEIYVLAKVLIGFNREKQHQVYKGVVKESLEEGYVNSASSLEVLKQMRQELGISNDEHRKVLEELGIEDPELLNPNRQWSLENQVRLNGYQKSLERILRLQQLSSEATLELSPQDSAKMRSLSREYLITAQEEDSILAGLSPDTDSLAKAEFLLARLTELTDRDRALDKPSLQEHQAVVKILQDNIKHKQILIVQNLLSILKTRQNESNTLFLLQSIKTMFSSVLLEVLENEKLQNQWSQDIVNVLTQKEVNPGNFSREYSTQEIVSHLEIFLENDNSLIQCTALYLIAQLDLTKSQAIAHHLTPESKTSLVQETLEKILSVTTPPDLSIFSKLEKLVYLFNSDFFAQMQTGTLMNLGDRAEIRIYSKDQAITEAGDTCRELLLIIEGEAKIYYHLAGEVRIENLYAGQVLDELEVLGHSNLENTILADSETTRILAISVDAFDDLLDQDPDFARRVLELESQQLQKLTRSRKI